MQDSNKYGFIEVKNKSVSSLYKSDLSQNESIVEFSDASCWSILEIKFSNYYYVFF